MSATKPELRRARTAKRAADMADAFAAGWEAAIARAAAEIERKHIEGGHHPASHSCRTRQWILNLGPAGALGSLKSATR